MNRMIRALFITLGTVSLGLGLVGILVPILPTTPFLLLAAFFYARSSERFLRWLLTNRWFGSYISNYRAGRGLPLREKIATIVLLWAAIGFSTVYVVTVWWVRLVLILIAAAVTIHLVRLRTLRPGDDSPPNAGPRSPEVQQLNG